MMRLSVKETATVLGKSPRQVRYMIRQGSLKAVREGKSWRIDAGSLPLGDAARKALKDRLDIARETVDAALEPVAKALGTTTTPGAQKTTEAQTEERYSVRKLLAFETGREIYHALVRQESERDLPARQALFDGLVRLTQGCHAFRADEKVRHFRAARRQVATATAHLFLHSDSRGEELGARLEQELIPKLGGLVASQEQGHKKKKSSRFDRFGARRESSL